MSSIVVTSDDLRACAAEVSVLKSEMESVFSQIQSRIRQMSASWDSPAGRAAVSQFETLSPFFSQYTSVVDNYCLYLNQTAAAYDENETLLGGRV